jgi:hypothetical protein
LNGFERFGVLMPWFARVMVIGLLVLQVFEVDIVPVPGYFIYRVSK